MATIVSTPASVLSTHLLIELKGCDPAILDDIETLTNLLTDLATQSKKAVTERVFHQFRPNGVTGLVMMQGLRINIHTWPEERYASADVYTEDKSDSGKLPEQMRVKLGARETRVVEVKRANSQVRHMEVLDHRRVEVRHIDLRGEVPSGIRLGTSPNRGFGLFADRDFASGEVLYVAPGQRVAWDAELIIDTDLGRTIHSGDSYGYEVSQLWAKNWSSQVFEAIANHYKLQDPELADLIFHVTAEDELGVIIMGFDGLINHSTHCNARLQWSEATLEFDEWDEPAWHVPLRALRVISAGEELFVDYNDTLLDFIPPGDWLG